MSAYYNDNDPYCCQWLRNLIAEGLIAPGNVDERPIQDVQPDDLKGYTQAHFFAGIGGYAKAQGVRRHNGQSSRMAPQDGLPGRMAIMRAFGNAIVPQVAAEFIKAAMWGKRMSIEQQIESALRSPGETKPNTLWGLLWSAHAELRRLRKLLAQYERRAA